MISPPVHIIFYFQVLTTISWLGTFFLQESKMFWGIYMDLLLGMKNLIVFWIVRNLLDYVIYEWLSLPFIWSLICFSCVLVYCPCLICCLAWMKICRAFDENEHIDFMIVWLSKHLCIPLRLMHRVS